MADLTPERIAELRRTKALDTPPYLIYDEDLDGLLDMAERCAKAEAELADAMAFAAMWKQRAEASEARGEA